MTRRDDFPPSVKKAIALRAGYRCSFTGCTRLTVGPSEESPMATSNTGIASHIHAASPGEGARRYLATMSREERRSISNAIWMCGVHAILIDRDEETYPAESLKQMKMDHESRIAAEHSGVRASSAISLIALGPEVIATGELVVQNGLNWTVRIDNFVTGDVNSIIEFGEKFESLEPSNRYILSNALGDGRTLSNAPIFRNENSTKFLDLVVERRLPRISAHSLKADLKVVNFDLSVSKGGLEMVSGLNALPQKIQLNLGMQRGESPIHPEHGSRTGEFYRLFGTSVWFEQLIKLELIRLASISRRDGRGGDEYLPFECVEKVNSIKLLVPEPVDRLCPASLVLTVNGVGEWIHQISLFIPT